VPDDLPWEDVLGVARRYLGDAALRPQRLGPCLQPPRPVRQRFSTEAHHVDHDDPWQFTNFQVD
jgi:homospermidine synthase